MAVKQVFRLVIFFSNIVFIDKYLQLTFEKPKCSPFDLCLSLLSVIVNFNIYLVFLLLYSYVFFCDYNNRLLVFASMVIEILMLIART